MSSEELPWFRLSQPASPEEVERARAGILRVRAAPLAGGLLAPFCVITPLGMNRREKIRRLFESQGIEVQREYQLDEWSRASTLIYARTLDEERMRVVLLFEALWRQVASSQLAEVWVLAGEESYRRMADEAAMLSRYLGLVSRATG